LLKSSTFIRSLQMDLYRSNINLKIDIPYSLPLLYLESPNIDTSVVATISSTRRRFRSVNLCKKWLSSWFHTVKCV